MPGFLNKKNRRRADLHDTVKEMSEKIRNAGGLSPDLENFLNMIDSEVVPLLKSYSPEEEERSRSVVIFGIPESTQDTVFQKVNSDRLKAYDVLNELQIEAAINTSYRLGTKQEGKPNKPRLLKVVFASRKMQHEVIINAKKLRDSSNQMAKKVFINPCYTKEQLEVQKKLAKEVKERRANGEDPIIHKGAVIDRKDRPKNQKFSKN